MTRYLLTLDDNETVTDYRGLCILVVKDDYEGETITVFRVWIETPVGESLGYAGRYYHNEQEAVEAGKRWIRQHPNAKPLNV
jgi:hypothetical protein